MITVRNSQTVPNEKPRCTPGSHVDFLLPVGAKVQHSSGVVFCRHGGGGGRPPGSATGERRKSFTFFHLSKLFFIQNYCFLYHSDQKISWWRIFRWRVVNFEIHLCSSGVISDCIWRSYSIQYVQNLAPAWTLTSGMVPFGSKSETLSMLIDVVENVREFDRISWPLTLEMFTFYMLAMVVSESSFGAYVCL